MVNKKNALAIERLTALWALNESGLGGLMHAFSTPFTGILVGGISILLISLIALYSKNVFPTLLKALSIVLIVKLGVSPHSPITAYIAVSFQAVLGAIFYSLFNVKTLAIVLLASITFLESALQKLLTLTILYGQSFWDAIDVYGAWISDKFAFLQLSMSSKTLIVAFVSFYWLAGILAGILIIRTLSLIKYANTTNMDYVPRSIKADDIQKPKSFLPRKIFIFWGIILFIITIPLIFFETKYGGLQKGIYVLARSFLILILWYTIVGPLLLKGINKMLIKSKGKYKVEIQNTLELLPFLRGIIRQAWQDSKLFKGHHRMENFLAKSVVYSIHFSLPKK